MRTRKTRKWMHAEINRRGLVGRIHSTMGDAVRRARSDLEGTVMYRHSSKTRPLTLSVIHARINVRATSPPGFMLACRREGMIR